MKNVRITNISKQEEKSLEILKKHYGIKTDAGAMRKAAVEMAEVKTHLQIVNEKINHLKPRK